jgi:hypothetical protein
VSRIIRQLDGGLVLAHIRARACQRERRDEKRPRPSCWSPQEPRCRQQKTRPHRTGRSGDTFVSCSLPEPFPGKVHPGTNEAGLLARGGASTFPGRSPVVIRTSTPGDLSPGPLTVAGPRRLHTGLPDGPVRGLFTARSSYATGCARRNISLRRPRDPPRAWSRTGR